MVPCNDILGRADSLRGLIAQDQIDDAISQLMDFVRDFSNARDEMDEVTLLSSSFRRLEKTLRRQELAYDEAERYRRSMLSQVLRLVDDILKRPRLPRP